MQVLPNRQLVPGIPDVRPGVSLLRRAGDSAPGSFTDLRNRMHAAKARDAGAVAEVRPQRSGDSPAGEGAAGYWPGYSYGVRPPAIDETPLSYEEVIHSIERGEL